MQKIIPYIVAGIVAIGSYFAGAVTDLGAALQIALDKDKAKAQCVQLINGDTTPETDITQ